VDHPTDSGKEHMFSKLILILVYISGIILYNSDSLKNPWRRQMLGYHFQPLAGTNW
jgi:hypothetical protein